MNGKEFWDHVRALDWPRSAPRTIRISQWLRTHCSPEFNASATRLFSARRCLLRTALGRVHDHDLTDSTVHDLAGHIVALGCDEYTRALQDPRAALERHGKTYKEGAYALFPSGTSYLCPVEESAAWFEQERLRLKKLRQTVRAIAEGLPLAPQHILRLDHALGNLTSFLLMINDPRGLTAFSNLKRWRRSFANAFYEATRARTYLRKALKAMGLRPVSKLLLREVQHRNRLNDAALLTDPVVSLGTLADVVSGKRSPSRETPRRSP